MWLLLTLLVAIYPVTILIECLIETHRRRAGYQELVSQWRSAPPGERANLTTEWLKRNPRCGAAWYLQGVLQLRSGRMRDASRAFGMAHHCDTNLVSAALFTFVCLKTSERSESSLENLIESTWVEMKRPLFGQFDEEKIVLGALKDDSNSSTDGWPLEQITERILARHSTEESTTASLDHAIRAV